MYKTQVGLKKKFVRNSKKRLTHFGIGACETTIFGYQNQKWGHLSIGVTDQPYEPNVCVVVLSKISIYYYTLIRNIGILMLIFCRIKTPALAVLSYSLLLITY